MSRVTVRALSAGDSTRYNEFFRRGTEAHPDTLRISPADIAATPLRTEHGSDGSTLVAQDTAGHWLGVVTIEREVGREKRRHVAWVLRMYVTAESTRRGVGRTLLEAALTRARELPDVEKVNLTVAAHNAPAVRLYESVGFRVFAREEDAFRDPEPRTELTMALRLQSPEPEPGSAPGAGRTVPPSAGSAP